MNKPTKPLPRLRDGSIAPPPTYAEVQAARRASGETVRAEAKRESSAKSRMRQTMRRFAAEFGQDTLIAFLKTELANHGEERWRLDQLAPHPGDRTGQTSILDAGR